jgi:aminopeptidase N
MPYSESSGFTSDLRDPASFNSAFYVVSHEVAHQWWGYQLLSADVEGGKFLAEALADYTAMMVLEQEFGAEITRRFLRNRTRHYLQSRVAETDSEHPLWRSRIDQDYLFYSKGSLVMYQLRQLIGEDRINTALRNLLQKFGGGNPPYATSLDLLESLRQQTPIEHHQILDELFNQITLFQNQTRGATAQKLANNTWQVTLQVECRKIKSDGDGTEQDIPFEQFVEVGAFSQPKEGRRFGEPLYQKQHLLKSGTNSITFNTTERPDTAGIDPFLLLIDRTPEDNVVEVCDP